MAARVLVVEHQATCPPGLIGEWLTGAGLTLDIVRPWAGDDLLDVADFAGYLVLGGEMGANDDETVDWLAPVKEQVRRAVSLGVPTLGICLGHQLMAVALGGAVGPNPAGQTVGLTRIGWTPARDGDALVAALDAVRGIHWNNDVATRLPPSAVVLATTPDGAPQIVRFGDAAWGTQLHPEADARICAEWARTDYAHHAARGVDQAAVLGEIEQSTSELAHAWQPLATRFAELVVMRSVAAA